MPLSSLNLTKIGLKPFKINCWKKRWIEGLNLTKIGLKPELESSLYKDPTEVFEFD